MAEPFASGLRSIFGRELVSRLFAFPRILYLSILTRKGYHEKGPLVSLYFLAAIGAFVSANHAVAQQVYRGFEYSSVFHESNRDGNERQFVVIRRPIGGRSAKSNIQLKSSFASRTSVKKISLSDVSA